MLGMAVTKYMVNFTGRDVLLQRSASSRGSFVEKLDTNRLVTETTAR